MSKEDPKHGRWILPVTIAALIGFTYLFVTALPPAERLVLLTGRLIREALLQQSALSDNDASCSPDKQAALAQAVLAVHDTTAQLSRAGVPASVIEEFDYGPLIRAKDATGPDDSPGIFRISDQLLAELDGLSP